MQTDRKLRKYPDDGFVQTFEAGEMDRNFAVKSALAVETAPITCHGFTFESTFRLILDEGNTHTVGFSRPSQPGKWRFISALNLL